MTNKEIKSKMDGLIALRSRDESIPAVVSYRVIQNIQRMAEALKPFSEAVDETIRKHSGGKESISADENPEAFSKCAEEIATLEQLEVDLKINHIKLSDISECLLPISTVFAMDFMIEEEE